MHEGVNQLVTAAVSFTPRLASSIVALLSFWAAALVLSAVLGRVGRTTHLSAEVLALIQRIVKVGVLMFGVVTALGTAGINVSALVAGLGLTGFALGFALKDILSNVLAGVLILMYRPFHRLDRVSVAGFEGTVAQIDLRYTTLEADNRRILIPNSTLFTNVISVEAIQQSSGEDPAAERDPAPDRTR
jgi:small-conductance mechanosensitive channel